MRVLVTGNRGYIGTVLVPKLQKKKYAVCGLDTEYYFGCHLGYGGSPDVQNTKDIRDITIEDLQGFDAVIHLAALSNDPLGEFVNSITHEINLKATVRLAELAKRARIKRFIYSSSQSMYGISNTEKELDEDAPKNPLTAYARTKWSAEQNIMRLSDENFSITCLRPSTVFGVSPMLRCDIVFNNLVACAYTTGKIEIKSDGTPWRPVVHIQDVCNAFIAVLEAPLHCVSKQSFNVGILDGNYTVRDLAEAAQRSVPGSKLVFTGESPDNRTYKVSFDKILTMLRPYYTPEWTLDKGGKELVKFFKEVKFTEEDFRVKCVRFKTLAKLMLDGKLNKELRWV